MKKLFLIILTSLSLNNVNAQEKENYIHYTGVGSVITADYKGVGGVGVYNSRYVLKAMSPTSSIGLTTYFGMLFQSNSDSRTGTSETYFAFDIPVLIQYDFGRHATYEANNRFGCFVGAGLGISGYPYEGDEETIFQTNVGPMASGGFRVKALNRSYQIRGSYMLSLSNNKPNVYGISICTGLNRNEEIREKISGGGSRGGSSSRKGNGYQFKNVGGFNKLKWSGGNNYPRDNSFRRRTRNN